MISKNPDAVEPAVKKTTPLAIGVAWLVVCVPAFWGVSQTIRTSMRLFQRPVQTPPTVNAAPVK